MYEIHKDVSDKLPKKIIKKIREIQKSLMFEISSGSGHQVFRTFFYPKIILIRDVRRI